MSSLEFSLRVSVRNLEDDELENLREAYRQMQSISDNRGYNFLAGYHGVPGFYCWHHQRNRRNQTAIRLFLPWHRAYLYRFEQAAKDFVSSVTIPWWDWRSEASRREGIPQAFAQEKVNGKPNPLYNSHIFAPTARPSPIDRRTRRFPGKPSSLPAADTVEELLKFSDYGDFNDEIEGYHDSIHGWTGGRRGDMASVGTAAYDPIFWSHHCMIDRIWRLWQLKHGINNIPSQLLDMALPPFELTVKDVLNVHDLGYDYAGTSISVGGTGG